MDINENELKKISIRGRVAYGIACFERALIFYHCKNNVWIDVIKKLWDYTSIEYIDDWYYEMAEYIPDSLLETDYYDKDDFEYLAETDFRTLKLCYKESNIVLSKIFRLIFEIGTLEIYGKLENYSVVTLKKLLEIIELMKKEKIKLPDEKPFLRYKYSEYGGWGERFNGQELSILLKNV
ncbi:hypothetical protein [Coprococcus comes]|uniref:hypothetical protein n=1 Tax=Coprococcus comes TaxID=410072 RepID=UPI001C016A90|nr:hypothetical protein [Coprococcus comes]MBT9783042.1 hypothetical protein [Coprococcus comes]